MCLSTCCHYPTLFRVHSPVQLVFHFSFTNLFTYPIWIHYLSVDLQVSPRSIQLLCSCKFVPNVMPILVSSSALSSISSIKNALVVNWASRRDVSTPNLRQWVHRCCRNAFRGKQGNGKSNSKRRRRQKHEQQHQHAEEGATPDKRSGRVNFFRQLPMLPNYTTPSLSNFIHQYFIKLLLLW